MKRYLTMLWFALLSVVADAQIISQLPAVTNLLQGTNLVPVVTLPGDVTGTRKATLSQVERFMHSNMFAGRVLWVDAARGVDSTALREGIVYTFRTPGHAKTNANAGDLIFLRAGDYTNQALLKNNVQLHFEAGAKVYWYNTNGGNGWGILDDRATGATTNVVSGWGTFIHVSDRGPTPEAKGAVYLQHSNSYLSFHGKRIEDVGFNAGNGQAGIWVSNCYYSSFVLDEISDSRRGFDWDPDPIDEKYNGSQGIYWENGEMHVKCNRIEMPGYAIYANQVNYMHPTQQFLGVEANIISSLNHAGNEGVAAIYCIGRTNLWKVWIRALEIRGRASLYDRGKYYIEAQKIGSRTVGALLEVNATVPNADCEAWVKTQKLTSKGTWATLDHAFAGKVWLTSQEYEDGGGMTEGFINRSTNGAVLNIVGGGIATATNVIGILHGFNATNTVSAPGTTEIQGLKMKVVGTATNKWPVEVRTNGLILHNCVLVAGASGTTNSIVATNGPQDVLAYNGLTSNTNAHPNINLIGSTLTVNGRVR